MTRPEHAPWHRVALMGGQMNWDRVNRENREIRERVREERDGEERTEQNSSTSGVEAKYRTPPVRPIVKGNKSGLKMSKRQKAAVKSVSVEQRHGSPRRAAAAMRRQLLLSAGKNKKKRNLGR